jgi:uncharacterized membrane protein
MAALFQLLLVIHVLSAALWFGGAVFMPRALREALQGERAEARRRLPSLLRQGKVLAIAAITVIASGIALALIPEGGFAALPMRFHIALALALIWLGIGLLVARPTTARIAAIAASEAPLDSANRLLGRVSAAAGVQHLLFTVVLVLMLWRL